MPWEAIKTALGMSEGGGLRQLLDRGWDALALPTGRSERSGTSQVAFTIALIALAAKMSKADGVTTCAEVRVFEAQFQVPDNECQNVRRLFNLASQDTAGFESYARQVANLLRDEPEMRVSVLECLFHVATADGVLHPAEEDYLHTVALILGIEECEFACMRRAFVKDPDSPYEILNVDPRSSNDDIKARYRELVRSHHPDLLISKGVPEEYLAAAGRRLAAITNAYHQVQRMRGQRAEKEFETTP